jgi:L-2,4-diaminobutyrate decarboxylase
MAERRMDHGAFGGVAALSEGVLFVAGTAGTAKTGAVDLLPELAGLCHEHGVRVHVDGACRGRSDWRWGWRR